MSEQVYENVGDFVFCFDETSCKGAGIFTFTIKNGDNASAKQPMSKTSPTSSNDTRGQVALDQLSSREIERQLANHLNLTSRLR